MAPAPPSRLLNRNFLLLWQGQAVSQLGNQAFAIAMVFWAKETTGSASLMGALLAASALPSFLLAPLGGALADRAPRLRIALLSDLAGGALLLGLAALFWQGGPRPLLIAALVAVALLLGTLVAFLTPALSAALPDLVPAECLPAANAMNQLAIQASIFAGQGLGGVLFTALGAPLLFALDGFSFLLAAGSTALTAAPAPPPRAGLAPGAAFRTLAGDIAQGFAYARETPGLLGFVLAAAAFNFFSMPLLVLLPFYVETTLGRGAGWYGFLMAAISLGAVAGYVIVGALPLRGRARSRFLVGLMLVAPQGLAALGVITSPRPALAAAFALGLVSGAIGVYVMTALQATTPPELRGRMMGLFSALTGGAGPLGLALGGIVGDLTGKNIPLVAFTAATLATLAALAAVSQRSTREFLAYEVAGGEGAG